MLFIAYATLGKVTQACDYIRSSLSKWIERYEDNAFKAGQRAAGMTQAEASELQKQDEDEQQRLFTRITGMVEQLALCEVRGVRGVRSGEAEVAEKNGGPMARKFLIVSPDCEPCKDLKARIQDQSIKIVDVSTDEGTDFLERCLDEGITFMDAPQAILEKDGKLSILKRQEYAEFLGEKKAAPKHEKSGLAPGSYDGYSK